MSLARRASKLHLWLLLRKADNCGHFRRSQGRFHFCGKDGYGIIMPFDGRRELQCHRFFITAAGRASCFITTRYLHNNDSDDVVSDFFSEQRQKWTVAVENSEEPDIIEQQRAQGQQATGEGIDLFGVGGGGGRWKNWYMPGERAPGEKVVEEEGMWEEEGQGHGFEAHNQAEEEEEEEGEDVGWQEERSEAADGSTSVSQLQEDDKEVVKGVEIEHPERIIHPVPLPQKYKVTRKTKWMCKQLQSAALPEDLHERLRQWVSTMYPKRSDWVDLLEEVHKKEDKTLWFQILEFALHELSFEANIKDYLQLMLAYFNGNCDNDVERIAEKLQSSGLQPDLAVWTLLIDMHCRRGKPEKAREVFDQIDFYDLEPGILTITTLVDAYCSVGKPQEAFTFLKEMENNNQPVKVESYVAVIRAFGNLGQAEKADNVFRIFVLRQEDLDHQKYFMLLSALMDVYIQVEDFEKAEPIFENMLLGNLEPEDKSFAGILSLCEKKNLLEKAISMLLKLECKAMRPGVESVTCLIGWFQKLGLIDEAEMLFEELKRKKEKLLWSTCVAMYKLYVNAGLLDKARNILHFAEQKRVESNSSGYEQIIHALLGAGLHHEAQIMRNQMLEVGYAVPYEIEMTLTGTQPSL